LHGVQKRCDAWTVGWIAAAKLIDDAAESVQDKVAAQLMHIFARHPKAVAAPQ
jgi:hypothetical protein